MLNCGQNQRLYVPCDLQIWWMTLKNNRAPLLCCFKRCVSFHSHQWILTGVTIRKRQIWVKIEDFFVQCDFQIWQMTLKNNGAPLPCYFQGLCNIISSYVNSNWSYGPEMVKLGFDLCDLDLWHGHHFCLCNNSWKFNDDTTMAK